MEKRSLQFDVLVVGGGPAGLMSAFAAAAKGAKVALVEKNQRCGRKLLMSGGGRCNLAQQIEDAVQLARNYHGGRFLISAFKSFGVADMRAFLAARGVETKVEENGRVFPISDRGEDVLDALYRSCRAEGVVFLENEEILEICQEKEENLLESEKTFSQKGKIGKVITDKRIIYARNFVLATGGKSYAHTGSSGQGYVWAKKMGHSLREPQPALAPIRVKENWLGEAQGVSARKVVLTARQKGKKIAVEKGDLMVAHFGLSGPVALNISSKINLALQKGAVELAVDFVPFSSLEQLDETFRQIFAKNPQKTILSCLKGLASPKLLPVLCKLSGMDGTKNAGNVQKDERRKLAANFKDLRFQVAGICGFERAMVTSGGVVTAQIDSKTMRSKIISNLYFAGEIIDVDGPTGGYNLQMCWSSGFVAGSEAAVV